MREDDWEDGYRGVTSEARERGDTQEGRNRRGRQVKKDEEEENINLRRKTRERRIGTQYTRKEDKVKLLGV